MAELSLAVIVPVYRNEGSIPELVERLSALQTRWHGSFEATFVVDGSPDRSSALLRQILAGGTLRARVLELSRNFGSFAAIRAGLEATSTDLVAVMAADLQEPPELVLDLAQTMLAEDLDVVVGTRTARKDPLVSRLASGLFWRLYRSLIGPELPVGGVDVFACNERFKAALLGLGESRSSLVALLFWVGFRRGQVGYERQARVHGRSAWSFQRKIRYMLDSVFSFSEMPLRVLEWLGLLGIVAAVLIAGVTAVAKVLGEIPVPGYAATVIIVVFFGSLNLLGLGIIGEYVARAFENTKGRPGWIVADTWNFPNTEPENR